MATIKTDFVGAAYQHRSKSVDCQECVNLYPEIEQGNSKSIAALIGTPGLILSFTVPNNAACRGLYSSSLGRKFSINGNKLYEKTSATVPIVRGSLITYDGMCTFADDGYHLIIADGTYGYQLNLTTNAFSQITDSGFIGGSHVIFVDQTFIMNRHDTGQFAWASERTYLTDNLVWDVLDYATAESFPDNLKAILKNNNEIWLYGDKSVEVWYDAGGATGYSFQRIRSAVLNFGVASTFGCATNGQQMFWLGSNNQGQGIVFKSVGYQAQRISTHAIEYIIGQFSRIDNMVSFCYQQEGHEFFIMHFPNGDRSLCYDNTTGLWHERTSYDTTNNVTKVHRGIAHALWDSVNMVGDYENGKIYELDLDIYSDNTAPIRRVRVTPHIHKDGKMIFYQRFELDMEKGVGIDGDTGTTGTPQGVKPRAMLSWSDDGGFTWSKEYWTDMGAMGEYGKQIVWNGLGCSRDRVFKVVISDPVKCVFTGAIMDIEVERGQCRN